MRTLHSALVLAILMGVAGCTGSRPPRSSTPALAAAQSVLSSTAGSLLEKWYRNRAEQQLIEQCMAHHGFVYTVPEMGPAPDPKTITAFTLGSGAPGTYGVTPETFTAAPPSDPGSDQLRYQLALDGPASAMGTVTLSGAGTISYEIGGRQGSAREQLYGSVNALMVSVYLPQAQEKLFSGFLSSDQAYLSALHAWQACMRAAHLPVTNPDAAADSLQQLASNGSAADLTRRQTALAAADSACDGPSQLRHRTNQGLERFVGSLSPKVLTEVDDVARSRARATRIARQIVSP